MPTNGGVHLSKVMTKSILIRLFRDRITLITVICLYCPRLTIWKVIWSSKINIWANNGKPKRNRNWKLFLMLILNWIFPNVNFDHSNIKFFLLSSIYLYWLRYDYFMGINSVLLFLSLLFRLLSNRIFLLHKNANTYIRFVSSFVYFRNGAPVGNQEQLLLNPSCVVDKLNRHFDHHLRESIQIGFFIDAEEM